MTATPAVNDALVQRLDDALPALADMARRLGLPLRAGQVILAGAATAAVPLTAGALVEGRVAGLVDRDDASLEQLGLLMAGAERHA